MYLTLNQRQSLFGDLQMKTLATESFELKSKIGTHVVHKFENLNTLSESSKDFIFAQCANVALDAFSQNATKEWEDDIKSHVLGEQVLFTLMSSGTLSWRGNDVEIKEGRVIAWCSMRYVDTSKGKMAYVSGIAVSHPWAGKGIGQALMKHAFKGCSVFSLRTQSPIMAQAFHRTVKDVSLHVYPFDKFEESQEFALEISEKLGMEGIDNNLMFSKVYGGTLYGLTQVCVDGPANVIFHSKMQMEGDAYLCLAL